MRPDTVLQLGDFAFSRYEIPERIPFGGDQHLVTHEMVGGVRVVDAMGRSDMPLEWSGLLLGENAFSRALYLDGLRVAGKPLALTWSELAYTVVIKSFAADFERFYKLPYRICCLVVTDLTQPVTMLADPGIDALIDEDMTSANALGALIGDSPLSSALSTLDSAISAVSSFATAVQSTINTVLTPLAAVVARVQILIASTGNVITNVTTLGGILPNNPIATQAAKLSGQIAAMTQLPQLYNLLSVLGRMSANLGTIGKGAQTITTAGGNLYAMAAEQYGDATAWTTIAKANRIADPQLSGVNSLLVPAAADGSGGVLSA